MFTLADLLEALTATRLDQASLKISEAHVDSRQVTPNSLFVALPGENTDGHAYIGDAFQRGANLALVQQDVPDEYRVLDIRQGIAPDAAIPQPPFCLRVENSLEALQQAARYWRRKHDLRVIGITGSVGKSTTKELVAEVLSERYVTLKNPGNYNNEIGLPLTLLKLDGRHQRAVLEMGFYVPGEISFLCDIARPHVGVITNVGTVHAERAGSQEVIARGKAELVQALPPAPEGTAILNYDDPWVRPMEDQTRAYVFTYGLDPHAHLWASHVEGLGLKGIKLQLHFRNEVLHLRVPLIGRHSVHTVLRATAVGLVEGVTWSEIVHALQQTHNQLRMVAVRSRSGALIIDDSYNASPESMLAALNLLDELTGRKIAVLGEMLELGPYAQASHELIGRRAAEVADVLVTVGELGKVIATSARQHGLPAQAVTWVPDTMDTIPMLEDILHEGDTVLIKGSNGLHMDRIVAALESRS
ncbi:MAG TPA: UDP-N-acetylmuramoyl-tripeptide--D-alanyl-D-alanine ligase [Chloroflexi bacterium]|nr:UDP-N-acetylmuramoyl-tripeptide--D-alanyl-D-alanine ligase [Chloroflexota bacterium]